MDEFIGGGSYNTLVSAQISQLQVLVDVGGCVCVLCPICVQNVG